MATAQINLAPSANPTSNSIELTCEDPLLSSTLIQSDTVQQEANLLYEHVDWIYVNDRNRDAPGRASLVRVKPTHDRICVLEYASRVV